MKEISKQVLWTAGGSAFQAESQQVQRPETVGYWIGQGHMYEVSIWRGAGKADKNRDLLSWRST